MDQLGYELSHDRLRIKTSNYVQLLSGKRYVYQPASMLHATIVNNSDYNVHNCMQALCKEAGFPQTKSTEWSCKTFVRSGQ